MKNVSISYLIYKMYMEGYTHEQMQDFTRKELEKGDITLDDLIESFVDSRWNEINLKNRMDSISKLC